MRVAAMVIGILGSLFGLFIGVLYLSVSTGRFADTTARPEAIAIVLLFLLALVSASFAWRIPRQAGWTLLGVALGIGLLSLIPPGHGIVVLAAPLVLAAPFALFARRRLQPIPVPYGGYLPPPGWPVTPAYVTPVKRKPEKAILIALTAIIGLSALGFGAVSATMRVGDTDSTKVARLQRDFQATAVARRAVGDDSVAALYRSITYMAPAPGEAGIVDVHTTLAQTDKLHALFIQTQLLETAIDESGTPPLKYRIFGSGGVVIAPPL